MNKKKKEVVKPAEKKAEIPAAEKENFKADTGFTLPEAEVQKKEPRKLDVLRIRKSNTRNSLFENELGIHFIEAARREVKKSVIEENKEWFIVWEIIED